MFRKLFFQRRQSFGPLPQFLLPALLVLFFLAWAALPSPVMAQTTPATNPDLTPLCGLKVILALDESGSLQGFEPTVRNSVRGLLEGLADTGSQVALVEFNLDARTPLGAVYHEVTTGANGTLSQGGVFDLYLNNNYQPNGYTNWDAAFVAIEALNRNQGMASLVIFFTDSGPNVYINPFGTIVGGNDATALNEAVQSANLVKAQGSHIFVVGVGNITDEAKLVAISGPDKYPKANLAFGAADYTITEFAQLEATLREIVFNLCAPSFVVTKRINTGSGLGYELKPGQPFTGTVSIVESGQAPDAFEWALPVAGLASQIGRAQTIVTNHNGMARWQWEPGSRADSQSWASQFNLAETLQPGDSFVEALCTRRTLGDNGSYTASNFTVTSLPTTVDIGVDDIVLCEVRNSHVDIAVKKTANPTLVPESGGDVTFTFEVFNGGGSNVALTGLVDTVFGNLHGQGNCIANGLVVISANTTYRCSVTKKIAGNAGTPHVNTVTATVSDAQGVTVSRSANATVTFSDASPSVTLTRSATPLTSNEPGGLVVYSVQITNNSAGEAVTLTGLSDTPYGNVTTVGGVIQSTTCTLPQTLARAGQAGATYSCNFSVQLTGPPGPYTDALTATLTDDDGNTQQLSKDQLITIVNVTPAATLTVAPSPAALPEPGGAFTFAMAVANTSAAEPLTLTSLSDSRYGNITAVSGAVTATTCTLPQTLAPSGQPNATYTCSFTVTLTGSPGLYANTVQATVGDDEGGILNLTRASEVEISDVPASLVVTKRAARTSLPEPGGNMTFTVTVRNTSQLDHVRIDQVVDDKFGDISSTCTPALPVDLAPQQGVNCVFVRSISGVVGERHTNEVIASGVDDDGHTIADSDQEIIEITDVPARLDILQIADPSNLPEPGGTVTFTAIIENISAVDAIRIDKVETNGVDGSNAPGVACTPALPIVLAPEDQLQCLFHKDFFGPIGARHTSSVVVTGADDDGVPVQQTGYETVDIVNVPSSLRVTKSASPVSVPEAGGMVDFTIQVQNTSAVDTVTLQSLTNSQFGSLADTCEAALPIDLAPGATLTCHFSRLIQGDTNALISQRTTASGTDDDGHAVSDDAVIVIGITDTPASIKVLQTATPTSLSEPGGEVLFTVTVENTSPVDDVTINGVQDSRFGDMSSSCEPSLPAILAPQATLTCRYTRTLSGEAGATFSSTVSVIGVDDDAQTVADFDLGNLDITDVAPQLLVDVTASPNRVLETGGLVTYTVALHNHGPESITIESLADVGSNGTVGQTEQRTETLVQAPSSCLIPYTLAAGETYTCTLNQFVTGSPAQSYQARIVAVVVDNDGNRVQVADEAEIFLIAVSPDLELTKRDFLLVDHYTSEQDRGKPSPGDTLGYEIVVRNNGNGAATDVVLTDAPDANSTLVVGSAQTSQGVIAVGNTATDWLVVASLGEIASGEEVTVTLAVTITEGAGATLLRNQATVSQGITGAAVAGSDDPDTAFFGDPTDTTVYLPPTDLLPGEEPLLRVFLPWVER